MTTCLWRLCNQWLCCLWVWIRKHLVLNHSPQIKRPNIWLHSAGSLKPHPHQDRQVASLANVQCFLILVWTCRESRTNWKLEPVFSPLPVMAPALSSNAFDVTTRLYSKPDSKTLKPRVTVCAKTQLSNSEKQDEGSKQVTRYQVLNTSGDFAFDVNARTRTRCLLPVPQGSLVPALPRRCCGRVLLSEQ